MMKKVLSCVLILFILLVIPITTINAKTIADIQKELDAAQKKLNDTNVKKAINKTGIKTVALAGGVSANSYIRREFFKLEKEGIKVYMPDLKLCTDNAAMIASAGYYNFINGKRDEMDLNAIPNLKL